MVTRSTAALLALPAVMIAAGLQGATGGYRDQDRQPGGPPPVFRTEAPQDPINVIAGAPTGTSIRLSLLSREIGRATVTWQPDRKGDGPGGMVQVDLPPRESRVVALTNLKVGTRYRYVVTHPSTQPLAGHFTTARPAGTAFTFAIQADSHLDGNTDLDLYRSTLSAITASGADFLVDLGDTFMVDKYRAYRDSLAQYQAQRHWLSLPGLAMPIFLCLGNHDGEYGWRARDGSPMTSWSRQQRQAYFPSIAPGSFYSGAPAEGLYYSWTWGDALFVVLDPFVATTRKPRSADEGWNWTLGDKQYRWLEGALQQSRARFRFVFIHHLVGGSGKDARGGVEASRAFEWGGGDGFARNRPGWGSPIHALLARYGVTAVFHGHDHLYARQERDGIAYIEVPQPGHRAGDEAPVGDEYGYREGKVLGGSGYIRVSVGAAGAVVDYVRTTSSAPAIADTAKLAPSKPAQ